MKTSLMSMSLAACLALCACSEQANTPQNSASAQTNASASTSKVQISDAWVRANAPGQSVGAAYMTFNTPQDLSLVYAETARAGSVEIHSMSMDNGVMKMRMLEELTLKANETTKLAPGGFHFMLFDLPEPLKAGEEAEFRLCFKDKKGDIIEQLVTLPVKEAE